MKKKILSSAFLFGLVLLCLLPVQAEACDIEKAVSFSIDGSFGNIAADRRQVRREESISMPSGGILSVDNDFATLVMESELREEYLEEEYLFYTYEADYDEDGQNEAFVLYGKRSEKTDESVFGSFCYTDMYGTIYYLRDAVFFKKEPEFLYVDGRILVCLEYMDGIEPAMDVYEVKEETVVCRNQGQVRYGEELYEEIAGEEFIPGTDLLERMENAEDFRHDEGELYYNYAYSPQLLPSVSLISTTEHFTLYLLGKDVVIKTADAGYIYADIWITSNYMTPPEIKEEDLDGDGMEELAMILYVRHGTGLRVYSLYVADQDEDGAWKLYYLVPLQYEEALREHIDTLSVEGGVRFCFEGEPIGTVDTTGIDYGADRYEYDVGNLIDFYFTTDGMKIEATVEGISTGGKLAISACPGYVLSADVCYNGAGKWNFADVSYDKEAE